jgi:hypothetical protein
MTAARLRLLIAFLVFAGWVGWLAFQSLTEVKAPVISRAQLLISTHDIIGLVQANPDGRPATKVEVQEVHWPRDGGGLKTGDAVQVINLPDSSGFGLPGQYILPLVAGDKAGEYRIAGLPPSPGFDTIGHSPHMIYALSPQTRKQLDTIPKRPK